MLVISPSSSAYSVAISELLNLAYANHEATPNHMDETFEFWQNFGGI
jgi:hypothetical protein